MPQESNGPSGASDGIYDLNVALERMDGDSGLLDEVIDIFLDDVENSLTELREASDAKDQERLQRAAHTLKGAVGNFVATPASEAALRVETLCKDGDVPKAVALTSQLEAEVSRLATALRQYRRREAA